MNQRTYLLATSSIYRLHRTPPPEANPRVRIDIQEYSRDLIAYGRVRARVEHVEVRLYK